MAGARATAPGSDSSSAAVDARERVRLLCLVDVRGWAFDNIYTRIMPFLTESYDAEAIYYLDYKDPGDLLHEILYVRRPQVLHIFLRASLSELVDKAAVERCAKRAGHTPADVVGDLAALVITTCVYDHSALDPGNVAEHRPLFHIYDAYATASPILHDIYASLAGYPEPVGMLPDAVDLTLYAPSRLERLAETGRPFRIGWVGNSQWGVLEGEIDMKGVETVLLPGIAELRRRGVDAEAAIVDRSKQWLPRDEVAAYYNTLDAYVCVSRHEGTPNPVLEAMASGVPVVSTDVGIVRHVAGKLQCDLIIDRSPEALADALHKLLTTTGLREAVGRENLASIQAHTWEGRRDLWLDFLGAARARHGEGRRQEKIALLQHQLDRPRKGLKRRIRSVLRRYPALARAASRIYMSPIFVRASRMLLRLAPTKRRNQSR